MGLKSAFEAAMPYVIGIGVPIGAALAALALPVTYDLKGTVAELKATSALFEKGVDRVIQDGDKRTELRFTHFEKQNENSFKQINEKLDDIKKQMDVVVARVKDSEVDPATLLIRQGIAVNPGYAYATIGSVLFVFPKTPESEASLVQSGYRKEQITPVLSGYVVTGTTRFR